MRLACVQRGTLGRGVVGLREQTANPRGVGGAGVHAVDADALTQVIGGHRAGERQDGTLRRGVERTRGQPGGRGDRGGVHHGCGGRGEKPRQRGTRDPGDAGDVDAEHARPLVVVVVGDRADGADAGVVDHDVDATELLGHRGDRGPHRGIVCHVGLHGEVHGIRSVGLQVEHGNGGAGVGEAGGNRRPDSRGAARDNGDEAVELLAEILARLA